MVVGYEITWEPPSGVIKRHFGLVTGSDLLAAATTTQGNVRFKALRYVINDFSDCTELDVAPVALEEVAAIEQYAALTNPDIHVAIVAPQPNVVAIANTFVNDPFNAYTTRIFNDMTEARSWLGLAAT